MEEHPVEGIPDGAPQPLVIPGTGQRVRARSHRPRPLMMHLAVVSLAICIVLGALYTVLPIGDAATHFSAFSSLQSALDFEVPPGPRQTATMTYKVRPGDTLESIATRFHTTVDTILALNQLTAGDDLARCCACLHRQHPRQPCHLQMGSLFRRLAHRSALQVTSTGPAPGLPIPQP